MAGPASDMDDPERESDTCLQLISIPAESDASFNSIHRFLSFV